MFTRIDRTALVTTLGILAISVAAFAAPASAQTDTRSQAVHFNDLDLATNDGAAVLHQRIKGAVRSICGVNRAWTLKEKMDARACSDMAMADAMPRVQLAVAQARGNRGYAANSLTVRTGH